MLDRDSGHPLIFVLAGVNGAGKSSLGGALLAEHGLGWFNPDTYARELVGKQSLGQEDANAKAWSYGRACLEKAIDERTDYAFETTLGGNTIPALLDKAADTHDIVIIFCGLASPELHIKRVSARVARGGHDIPEDKIRERWSSSQTNLIRLLPRLAHLQVFDNSEEAGNGEDIPDPILVLEMTRDRVTLPASRDPRARTPTPGWATPIVQAAFDLFAGPRDLA